MAYTQQGSKLVGTGGSPNGTENGQGYSVALSNDGNTLALGSYTDDSYNGATWIFTRAGSTWTQQGSKLVGTGATGAARQGISVALSDDGNTLAVGGYTDDNVTGAVWIFTRASSTWTQQGSKLVGTGYVDFPGQGFSVELSSDGNTLAIGGSADDSGLGATWIFTRASSTWTQQGSKLVGTGYTGTNIGQGYSIALSSDGNTLAVGGSGDDTSIGATWIFTRASSTWTQQGSKLVGTGYTGSLIYQGLNVSLSSDGNTLSASGYYDNSGIGATWIFTRAGSTWTQQGSKLVGTGYTGSTIYQGFSVPLSGDGNTLAVGAIGDNSGIGATWIFTRAGSTWTQQGSKLVGTGYTGSLIFQGSASLSRDGSTLAVGGFGDNTYVGATWIFSGGGSTAKQFTLTNTGAASGTINSFTFNDPASIGHTANLANLGGGSAVTGNVTGLGYTLGVSSSIVFTVDYNDAGAGLGTYSGNIVIGGSGSTSQTITSTINVS